MTQDEIFKLAEKAGFHLSSVYPECGRIWWSDECPLDEELLRFAVLVAAAEREACNNLWEAQRLTDSQISDHIKAAIAAEREACAKVAEDYKESCYAGDLDWYLAKYIVDEIKARGKE